MDPLIKLGGLAECPDKQIRYFKENKIYTLQIESTASCNQRCVYCYAKAGPKKNGALLSDKIRCLIDEAGALEIKMIDWLGGDPLLRDDWYELMKYANEQKLANNLWTSGTFLEDAEVAERVVETTKDGYVSVHLDSLDQNIFKQLHQRNAEQTIHKVLKGVENLLSLGKSPDNILNCITYTSRQPPEDVKKTIKWFWEQKGVRTCLVLFKPAGFGGEMPELKPRREQIKEVFEYRDRLNYPESGYQLGVQDVNKFYCGTMFCVTVEGRVTPCSVIREGVASVHQESLEQIVSEHLNFLIASEMHTIQNLPPGCRECHNSQVCWGCRANAWYYASDIQAADPDCWLNPCL